jgi:ABC-type sugar transport system ATPase subunit
VTETVLEILEISKAFFGVHALRDINLVIHPAKVLGLIGENGAGKSTLMNIIGGIVQPDKGKMLLGGQAYAPRNPAEANHAGISFIHQELNLFANLTIAENIYINDFPKRSMGPFQLIDGATLRRQTRSLLEEVDLQLSPDTLVERLSPGERQLVEIARALQRDSNIIIFDEPTTSLTARETQRLFEIITQLRDAGKTIIYISHILADVMTLADEVCVLRDGAVVETGLRSQFDIKRMISLMVGRSIEQLYPPRESTATSEPVLETHNLSETGIVHEIDLTLHKSEVLGIFGLMGSGRTELARIIFGLDDFEAGEIVVHGHKIERQSPRTSINNHLAFVTENRREEGLLMSLSILENISLTSLSQFALTPLRIINKSDLHKKTQQFVSSLQIKAGNIRQQPAKSLSGGNQQKVVIAKWLMSAPSIFIMDEPTRGIDVGAKYEIYTIINDLASQGSGILFISSELEELMGMCDRIAVMSRGEIVGKFERASFDKEQILRVAFREGDVTA